MLGVCTLGVDEPSISVRSSNGEVIERFVRIALSSLEIDPRKLLVGEEGDMKSVLVYNSRLKRLMAKALEERERIYKYRNDYSGSYFAGLYDVGGSRKDKGIMLKTRDMIDIIVLERLGIGISNKGKIKGQESSWNS